MNFEQTARRTLANSQQRRNLAHATSTIRARRATAVAELPDWQELRRAGAEAKDQALATLDQQLVRLADAVERAGGRVHWAVDAEQACQIVADLARSHNADEIVKVKSITTEEIGLNDALATARIDVLETDLAELILQLSGDTSSHILVPAIHRNRAEIREIFRRTIGPHNLSDDPRALCAAARTYLRERFLSTRVAVSGANFAVAGTGTICVVESEGNGRMCLTLPEVLITVMGIEKVVAEWRDLEVFLQLLPRSATGEPMNPYTSLWTGVSDNDGPREFHLVLLDNGRSSVLNDPIGRQTLRCIRCSACLNSCPVYSRTGGHAYQSPYQGPIGAILSPQLFGLERSGSLPYASSLCGACYEVCPVEIDIPQVLVHLRGRVVEQGGSPRGERLAMRALAHAFSSRRRYEALQRTGQLSAQLLARYGLINHLPGPLSAWTAVRDFPVPPEQTFRQWWRERRGSDGSDRTHPAAASRNRGHVRPSEGEPVGEVAKELEPRAAILEQIRKALATTGPPAAVERRYRRRGDGRRDELVATFIERVAELGGEVHRAPGGEVAAVVEDLCRRQGARRMVVPHDLPDAWKPRGVELIADLRLENSVLDAADGALTGCAVAIAGTGTIVLDHAAGQGRRALTLVPDYHLCIVREEQIVGLVPEAIDALEPAARDRRPVTFISGPSATSDIELSRVEGVHGPRTLHVAIVDIA